MRLYGGMGTRPRQGAPSALRGRLGDGGRGRQGLLREALAAQHVLAMVHGHLRHHEKREAGEYQDRQARAGAHLDVQAVLPGQALNHAARGRQAAFGHQELRHHAELHDRDNQDQHGDVQACPSVQKVAGPQQLPLPALCKRHQPQEEQGDEQHERDDEGEQEEADLQKQQADVAIPSLSNGLADRQKAVLLIYGMGEQELDEEAADRKLEGGQDGAEHGEHERRTQPGSHRDPHRPRDPEAQRTRLLDAVLGRHA
mmetsp:Transcript_65965/g.184385  ORF Transcript_65965/g.184385 Transcript_65965/m.184385 type:complete len:256 (-) Transcript_65965:58-825(-)